MPSVEAKKNIPANILDALAKKGRSDQASISTPLFWTSPKGVVMSGDPPRATSKLARLMKYKKCSTHNIYIYIYTTI